MLVERTITIISRRDAMFAVVRRRAGARALARAFTSTSEATPNASRGTVWAGSASSSGTGARGGGALLLPGALTFGLGAWQLERRKEKIEAMERRAEALGRRVEASRAGDAATRTRTTVVGELECERTARVGPRARSVRGVTTSGALIVTPVRLRGSSGGGWFGRRTRDAGASERVLLVRGWAPESWEDAKGGACAKTEGVTHVSEQKGTFTPENDAKSDRWFWLDAPAIAESRGLPRETPLIMATRRGGDDAQYPIAVSEEELMQFPVSPEKHMGYALTWFTLSAFTTALAVARIRKNVGHRF